MFCTSAWIAVNDDPYVRLMMAPVIGFGLGVLNGLTITVLNVHSFLATTATSLIFKGVAIALSNGRLIPVRLDEFTWLGRDRIGGVFVAVWIMVAFALTLTVLLNRATFGLRQSCRASARIGSRSGRPPS